GGRLRRQKVGRISDSGFNELAMDAPVLFRGKDMLPDRKIISITVDELEGEHSALGIQQSVFRTHRANVVVYEPSGESDVRPTGALYEMSFQPSPMSAPAYFFWATVAGGNGRRIGTIAPRDGSLAALARASTSCWIYLTKSWIWRCISSMRSRICRMMAIPLMLTPRSRARFRMNSSRCRSSSV